MPKFNKVYISNWELRAPSVAHGADLAAMIHSPQPIPFRSEQGRSVRLETAEALVSSESPFYPRRADLKTMRAETVCAVDASAEMLSRVDLSESQREETSLYSSTSLSHGQTQKDIDDILVNLEESLQFSKADRNQLLMRKLHPLFGLKALTNAAESFVAQHTGVRGENATFGDTALAGYEALLASSWDLEESRTEHSLCLGTNCGGLYSLFALESYCAERFPKVSTLRESSAAAVLLLSSTPSEWRLLELSREKPEGTFDHVFSSSVYNEEAKEKFLSDWGNSNSKCHSSFDSWGSFGAASVQFSIISALSTSQENSKPQRVLIVEEDLYSQRCFIVLERTS